MPAIVVDASALSALGCVPPAEYEANLYRETVPAQAGTQ